jgi:hypothetical protein
MKKLTHIPVQTWKGWNPNDLFGGWFSTLGGFKTLIGAMFLVVPCRRSLPDITLPNPPGTAVLQNHYGSHYRKTAAHVMTLWKYNPLDQDDAL